MIVLSVAQVLSQSSRYGHQQPSSDSGCTGHRLSDDGMKDRVYRSMEMETLIAETLVKIKPTEPLRLANEAARRNLN
jgi:hypothetical protein